MSSGCDTGQDLKSLRGKMPDAPLVVDGLCLEVECGVVLNCVTKTTTYTPKGKLSYTSETVYTDKDGAVVQGKEVACPMQVQIIERPPVPVTLDGTACDGTALPATGNPGEVVQIVQAPGQVLTVRFCPEEDDDFELSCGVDPVNGHTIQTAYKIVDGQFVLIKRWDTVTGTEWTGDPTTLEGCGGTVLESEQQLMCDNGTEFLRWYTIKDGVPTGLYVDTDFAGAVYTPTGTVSHGACVVACDPSISSASADDIASLLPGHSVSVQKNNCCSLKVTTSAGAFIVSKDVTGYSTGDFDCTVTVTGVTVLSGTCSLADVIVTTQKLK